jgi:carbon storage regulator
MMLELNRRVGEEIFIDKGQIKIKVLSMNQGVVAIGISASREIDVDRKEIFFRKLNKPLDSSSKDKSK